MNFQVDQPRLEHVLRGIGAVIMNGKHDSDDQGPEWYGVADVLAEAWDPASDNDKLAAVIQAHLTMARALAFKGLCLIARLSAPPSPSRRLAIVERELRHVLCTSKRAPPFSVAAEVCRLSRQHVAGEPLADEAVRQIQRTAHGTVAAAYAAALHEEKRCCPVPRLVVQGASALASSRESAYERAVTARTADRAVLLWLTKNAAIIKSRGFRPRRESNDHNNVVTLHKSCVTLVARGLVEVSFTCPPSSLTQTAGVVCASLIPLIDVTPRQHPQEDRRPLQLAEPAFVLSEINSAFHSRGTDAGLLAVLAVVAGAVLQAVAAIGAAAGAEIAADRKASQPYVRLLPPPQAANPQSSALWEVDPLSMAVQVSKLRLDGKGPVTIRPLVNDSSERTLVAPLDDAWWSG